MKYVIVSPRLGTPGDTYTPGERVNVEALLAGGFIKKQSPPKPKKPSTVKTTRKEK
jgi:hypothetical protein